jgi:hypothetical protein
MLDDNSTIIRQNVHHESRFAQYNFGPVPAAKWSITPSLNGGATTCANMLESIFSVQNRGMAAPESTNQGRSTGAPRP